MNSNERINLTDDLVSVIIKLSEGNLGAVRVCTELFKEGARIDPDAFGGPLAHLLSLDSYGIYGSRIWMLYKDCCKENLVHVIAALRAIQLGLFPESKLKYAIENSGDGLNPVALFDAVCERLPNFRTANALEAETVTL